MQGGTYDTLTVMHARHIFAPGQLYVMLSRVTERRLLRIVGTLTLDMFQPVAIPGFSDDDLDRAMHEWNMPDSDEEQVVSGTEDSETT